MLKLNPRYAIIDGIKKPYRHVNSESERDQTTLEKILNGDNTKNLRQKSIKVLHYCFDTPLNPHYVANKIKFFGIQCLNWSSCKDDNGKRHYLFSRPTNLILSRDYMFSKSESIQKTVNNYLLNCYYWLSNRDTLSNSAHTIRLYSGYISIKDSSPKMRHIKYRHKGKASTFKNKYIWIDKSTHKSVFKELRAIRSSINNKLSRHKHGIIKMIVSKIENPHHATVKRNHIYSHCHLHFLLVIAGIDDVYGALDYVKNKMNEAVKATCNYKSTHLEIHPLIYEMYGGLCRGNTDPSNSLNVVASKNTFIPRSNESYRKIVDYKGTQPTIYGKDNYREGLGFIKSIFMKLSMKPKNIDITVPRKLIFGNVAFRKYFYKKAKPSQDYKYRVSINSNLLALITVDFYIEYLCSDYRIQVKDSDDFCDSKRLSRKQKQMTFLADINSPEGANVINSISKRSVKKIQKQAIAQQAAYYAKVKHKQEVEFQRVNANFNHLVSTENGVKEYVVLKSSSIDTLDSFTGLEKQHYLKYLKYNDLKNANHAKRMFLMAADISYSKNNYRTLTIKNEDVQKLCDRFSNELEKFEEESAELVSNGHYGSLVNKLSELINIRKHLIQWWTVKPVDHTFTIAQKKHYENKFRHDKALWFRDVVVTGFTTGYMVRAYNKKVTKINKANSRMMLNYWKVMNYTFDVTRKEATLTDTIKSYVLRILINNVNLSEYLVIRYKNNSTKIVLNGTASGLPPRLCYIHIIEE